MSTILMIVAPHDYRDEEFEVPRDVFTAAGHTVTVASKGVVKATGMLGGSTDVMEDVEKTDGGSFDAVVFVGGRGAHGYFHDEHAHTVARKAMDSGAVVAAICIAPSILANAGLIEGKRVTAFPSEEGALRGKGAEYTGSDVEVDGKVVTASGPAAAQKFADEILSLLKKG